jgi:sugar phosphate isomerase/epimerase
MRSLGPMPDTRDGDDAAAPRPARRTGASRREAPAGDAQVPASRRGTARRVARATAGTPRRSASGRGQQRSGPGSVPLPRVALSSASVYPQSCTDAFAYAADLGYDGVEVMVWTDGVSQSASALQRLTEHYSMPVLAIHAPTLLVTQGVWGRDPWVKLERSCELASTLGASTVVVHPPFRWQREYAAAFADGVAELSDRTGVTVAVENMYPWRARQREILAYLPGWDPVPQPYRDVTLDLSHTATAGVDGLDVALALGGRLAHLHLADGVGSAKDEHLIPGRGTQPCAAVLEHLARQGFSGAVVVEVNTRRARSRSEREADLAAALAFARMHLAAAHNPGVATS